MMLSNHVVMNMPSLLNLPFTSKCFMGILLPTHLGNFKYNNHLINILLNIYFGKLGKPTFFKRIVLKFHF